MNVVVLAFAFTLVANAYACPELCQCNTTTRIIDCSGRNLALVPEFRNVTLDKITLLDLSRNDIAVLNFTDLRSILGLSIETIDVSFNQIQEVIVAFNDENEIIAYRTLNLSNNLLTSFPANIAPNRSAGGEYVIDISHNALDELPANLLKGADVYGSGFQLLASNNRLKSIHPEAVLGLVVLDLRNNSLEYLPRDLKISEGFRSIKLADNPWRCDCNFRWIVGTRFQNLSQESPPSCGAPDVVRGRPLFALREDEFACAPVSDETVQVLIDKGEHQYLVCPVTSDPPNPEITWKITYLDGTTTPFSIEVQSTFLKLTNLKSNDVVYRCSATNSAGSVTVDIQVNVTTDNAESAFSGPTSAVRELSDLVTDVTNLAGSYVTDRVTANQETGNYTLSTEVTRSNEPPKRTVETTSANLFEETTIFEVTELRNQTSTVYWTTDQNKSASNICVSFSSFVIFLICCSVAVFAILATLLCTSIFCCHVISGQKQRQMDLQKRAKSVNEYAFDGPAVYAQDAEVATGNFHFTETSTAL